MLTVQNMHGLGDNLHSRAVIRGLLARGEDLQVITPWPSVFEGLPVRLLRPPGSLRTQMKNVHREMGRYQRPLPSNRKLRVWYDHGQIRRKGGFLQAMCAACEVPVGDFSLMVPPAWIDRALQVVAPTRKNDGRPLMVYRPLVVRNEWVGCAQRNPDADAYVMLMEGLRRDFFVVSVADLKPGVEWTVSRDVGADLTLHGGELDFQTMAGLVALADMVWCSPGFMLVLAQAIGTPMVAVFGGHESARLYDHGWRHNLFIQPDKPCECFDKSHACDKTITIPTAQAAIRRFYEERVCSTSVD